MPQGTREQIGRAAVVGLGVVLCSGLVGCMGDSGSKKSNLPPSKAATPQWNTTTSPPPGQAGATPPNRQTGTAQPGAAYGIQPGAPINYGSAPTGGNAVMGTPVRQNNAAVMSPSPTYPATNTLVPSVSPYSPGVQPAGGTTSQYQGNTLTPAPARVSQEPTTINAGWREPALIDSPTPPPAPSAFAPSVLPLQPVTTPAATYPTAPPGPLAPIP